MSQCTIKTLECFPCGASIMSKDGCFKITRSPSLVRPPGLQKTVNDEWSLEFTSPCGRQNISFADIMPIIEAKALAQETWNSYLKKVI